MFLFRCQNLFQENKHEQLFNPNDRYSCQYFDEDEFVAKIGTVMSFLMSLDWTLPKNGG